ncbi:hypothetical protein DKX38_012547 [Salix brachista]|uniref:Uncharacterized protein n=1 Tax=Salix brachista TaxID=2182728 RepID=A0A5N5LNR4_9ROSI|nr:hypothetical protein DKX38_012547 [Salix brachista]
MEGADMIECSACHSKIPANNNNSKAVARAYVRHRSDVSYKTRFLNLLLVVGDCSLVGLQPILVYMSKEDGRFEFSPISVNFLTETAKVFFAITMLLIQDSELTLRKNGKGHIINLSSGKTISEEGTDIGKRYLDSNARKAFIQKLGTSIEARQKKVGEKSLLSVSSFVQAARNNVIFAVPAFLYAINNYLKFIMQLYFNPATVKMLSNLKVLVIAVLLKMIMKRRFSILQWEALALLLIGICVNQLRTLPEGSSAMVPVATGAYLYTLIFVSVPSFASVYNEYALKSQFETSIYLQVFSSAISYDAYCFLAMLYFDLKLQFSVQLSPHGLLPLSQANLRNLFLYGYGAIFNFLAILVTAIFKGMHMLLVARECLFSNKVFHLHEVLFILFVGEQTLNRCLDLVGSAYLTCLPLPSVDFHVLPDCWIQKVSSITQALSITESETQLLGCTDTILKKYSSTVATIFTGIASAVLFGHTLTINFILGISIVFISMHQFFSPLSKVKDEPRDGILEVVNSQNSQRSKDSSFINMTAGANDDASHHVGHDEKAPLLPI